MFSSAGQVRVVDDHVCRISLIPQLLLQNVFQLNPREKPGNLVSRLLLKKGRKPDPIERAIPGIPSKKHLPIKHTNTVNIAKQCALNR